ncbi:zinc finger BED domain-containing protein RICESLEEPER 1-like [Apium graveolens]|uniref:zinc finger BED domain-containing protein RICESLEEPER 1-like n=1 Tax=Apium graveolens TaxID=4045 RepID=UPI003D79E25F
MDVPHRWNSTFEMLDVALIYEETFTRLEFMNKNYVHNPSKEEWKVAHVVRDCLKIFDDASVHFSGSKYPTSNVFFPDICEIKLQLREWEKSPDECLQMMAGPMNLKFSKYWDECSICLVVVILDPRFKIDIIEYYYDKIFGKELSYSHVERVRTAFFDLYIEYGGRVILSESTIDNLGYEELMSSSHAVNHSSPQSSKLNDFKRWRMME